MFLPVALQDCLPAPWGAALAQCEETDMDAHNKQKLPAITLAAIGVVYGDLGTSPLYTFKECFSPHKYGKASHGLELR